MMKQHWTYQYDKRDTDGCRLTDGSRTYHPGIFISVIENEYALRELVQRLEFLRKKINVLEKMADFKVDHTKLAQLNKELGEARRAHDLQTYQYSRAELRLGRDTLKEKYDSLRQNPSWYMRQELIGDCKDRGGCCSRDCGCCSERHLTSIDTQGLGHCTWDCSCCAYSRGFEFSAVEKEKARCKFGENLRSRKAAHLLTMTNGFFTEATSESESEPESHFEHEPQGQPDCNNLTLKQSARRWVKSWKR